MSAQFILDALALPGQALVEQRVPKKMLAEQSACTAADKRQIQDGVEELVWAAALKPSSIGVPEFRDGTREYLEIAVLTLNLRAEARPARMVELIHRAIPYPVVLLAEHDGKVTVSLAHKRLAQNEAGRMVLDGEVVTATVTPDDREFLSGLGLSAQPRADMHALYQAWIERVEALLASHIVGAAPKPQTDPAVRHAALAKHARLTKEIAAQRSQAEKETQMNRRVDLNLSIKRLEAQLAAVLINLQ